MSIRSIVKPMAVAGVPLVLAVKLSDSWPLDELRAWALLPLGLALVLVPITVFLLMPEAASLIARKKRVLIPLGVYTFAVAALGWLFSLPLLRGLEGEWRLELLNLTITLTVLFVLTVLLQVAYSAWATTAVLNTVREENDDPIEAAAGMRRWFWRVFGLSAMGWSVIFLALMVAFGVMARVDPIVGMSFLGIGSLLWNFATVAVLPVALRERFGFWQSLRAGMSVSWRGKRLWWKPVLAQMVLLGFVMVLHVTRSEGGRTTENSEFTVNVFWIGGYPDSSKWYSKFMGVLGTDVPFVSACLALLFGALSVAVKLTVADRMRRLVQDPAR